MKKFLYTLITLCCIFIAAAHAQTQCNPQFTWAPAPVYGNSLTVSFVNTTVFATPSPSAMPNCRIYFGDNTQLNSFFGSTNHTYAVPGTYSVKLYMDTYDSLSQVILCSDSVTQQVTINYPCAAGASAQNIGAGTFTFQTYNPVPFTQVPGQPTTPVWNFGDNSAADTGFSVTHAYALSGTYYVTVSVPSCPYPYALTVHYIDSTITCDSLSAGFSYNNNNGVGTTVSFYNTSVFSPSTPMQNLGVTSASSWSFGDGSGSYQDNPVHTYNAPGIYDVLLINSWTDSMTQMLICTDTMLQQVPVGFMNSLNVITGAVSWDSMNTAPAGFKVWLITHDATANTLEAVDSVEIAPTGQLYTFLDAPAGDYLVKAAALNQPAGINGWLPTYHDSSLYWSGAAVVQHGGNITSDKNIWMRSGTTTAGPGFIGGNISQGAGKGTGKGVAGMLVFLRNGSSGKILRYTYTNENGDYAFDQVPEGNYTIYPEAINYLTTPSDGLSIQNGHLSVGDADFEQTEEEIRPKGTSSIGKTDALQGITIYPNPAKNVLHISITHSHYDKATLVNTLGQVIATRPLHKGINSISTASLAPGMYYLMLNGKDITRSVKITRQ